MRSSLVVVGIALGMVAGLAAPCAARSIVIEDFAASVDVAADGSIEVEETSRLRFTGAWTGIRRSIPVEYRTPRGDVYRLRLTPGRVTDGEGRSLRFERSRERHFEDLKIFVPGASDAVQAVSVRCLVVGGLRFFDDHDEFYWNVTGDEWPYPIAAARRGRARRRGGGDSSAGPIVVRYEQPEAERRLLSGLFPTRSGTAGRGLSEPPAGTIRSVTTDHLWQRFHSHLPGIRAAVFDRLMEKGCYRERPDRFTDRHVIAAIVAVVIGFGFVRPPRTNRGVEALAGVRGFQEFLARVEPHRLASLPLTPDLFEWYLPFAMALGVEGRWAQAFEGICRQPPDWYVGTGPVGDFHSADLAGGLGRLTAVTSAAMQSAPRSSEGSGF